MPSPPVVAVVGTCDTKYEAFCYIKHVINASGSCKAILIDIGIYDPPEHHHIDISRSHVLRVLPEDAPNVSSRDTALETMTRAITAILADLYAEGTIAGVIGAGGSGNTSVCATAFRDAFPIGFPKLLVSTMASGYTAHYVGETDMTMMYSVVDIAGMNTLLHTILGNAAAAIASMALQSQLRQGPSPQRRSVAVTMFGLTTPCVQVATRQLEELGYSVVTFHATGSGGRSMERLIREGYFVGVLDLTTTELADELVGGVLTAGPHRLEAAVDKSIPQVVSVGALDMVQLWPGLDRPCQVFWSTFHPPQALGQTIADKLRNALPDRTRVLLPLRGFSGINKDGGPFWDVEADGALLDALRSAGLECPVEELDTDINDPSFAVAAVSSLHRLIQSVDQHF
ncbi:hypothetical protein JVT61DRAFT_2271 [Boletus reticuloceps]|uniref:Uncharacterized protein n=1 Tax=Boletus reticuloceps TaxID=495285 RepID=A0A8I3AAI7_9AGAM|nr:hypothetical protein JVT61DRAFT_2271 [Boletus reticuloceps]